MSYRRRILLFYIIDILLILGSANICFWLLNDYVGNPLYQINKMQDYQYNGLLLIIFLYILFIHLTKLHRKAWEYASIRDVYHILLVITILIGSAMLTEGMIYGRPNIHLIIMLWMMMMISVGGARLTWRSFINRYSLNEGCKKRTLIIGAGSAGTMLVRHFRTNQSVRFFPVALLDDDKRKQRLEIYGVPVVGKIENIEEVVERMGIEHIIIAIPSLKRQTLNDIVDICVKTKIQTQTMPMIEDIVEGKTAFNDIRDIHVEDLLGREPVVLDDRQISDSIAGKTLLVTGAGGSIGSEICRQISKYCPAKVILLGHGENSIYHIHNEMRERFGDEITYITEIADIQDREKIFKIVEYYMPDIIYHAAAHKHVHLMEWNPEEAIKNNIIGTKNVAEAADFHGISKFVMISTDKAVNPTGVMGSTKRLAEMIIQDLNQRSSTKFVAVRFGNVLGSRGSVIPLFLNQIKNGGPVTVTHPDMVRYFMTIPEAARLVIQAGALARGGEIFVLDMGEPVKILDLVHKLIKISGKTVEDINIVFTGMRPGEKLFEELLATEEMIENQVHSKIYTGKGYISDIRPVEELLSDFINMNKEDIRRKLLTIANHSLD